MADNTYTGTGFSHDIPFSKYENCTNEEILNQYNDTDYSVEISGECTYVVDGDTLDITTTNDGVSETFRVRLVGVNTPEKNADGYLTSKHFVEKLCLNQNIGINIDNEKEKDKYGRTLAVVIINGKNLNHILLEEGLAEIMYIPPSEFNPHEWIIHDEDTSSDIASNTISLKSTIINQKKKLFLYVIQSKDLVWPHQTYDYQVYVKNISGQTIENLKIYITNPKEVVIKEKDSEAYSIPTLKSGQSVLINVNDCAIMQEGYYYINFIAMADETEIKTKTLLIKCGYENDNKNILHRIAFYNFSPYEDAYMQRASDFSTEVTQLTKIQTKPFEAYNQPFEMDNLELDLYAQDIFLTNTDDIPSMYLGRENWESNLEESFTGQSLSNLIHKINQESDLVDIDFLRVGNNEMSTDFQQIFPNGFIYRFGLLKSEFYKLLGIIPNIYSINDDLFRWARSDDEPFIYPPRENDKWNQKPWCGTGYYVYELKIINDKITYTNQIAIFSTKEDAEIYIDNLETLNKLHFVEDIQYSIKKRDWLPGIFYVEIPLRDIPANFYIPSVDEIQATIELAKPYGLKGYPRFALSNEFNHKINFKSIPTISPHIFIDLGEYSNINYHIRQKKYQLDNNGDLIFSEYGRQFDFVSFENPQGSFYSYNPKPAIHKIFAQNIKYFTHDEKLYIHIYNVSDFNDMQSELGLDIDVLLISQDELINILHDKQIPIYGLYFDYNIPNKEDIIYYNDFINKDFILSDDFFVVIDSSDDVIKTEYDMTTNVDCNIPNFDKFIENISQNDNEQSSELLASVIEMKNDIQCNPQEKSFDGQRIDNNSLDTLLMKNPEDICFYIEDAGQFEDKEYNMNTSLEIPTQYKTLNYYDGKTSAIFDIAQSDGRDNTCGACPSAVKLYKQNLPQHVNINLLLSNKNKTTDYVISYKLLYDDVYQISYKTYKKTEVVRKEIVTKFDYILCEIDTVSSSKDLIKIYYALENKLYFITSFTANIIDKGLYQVRVSLTNDLTLPSKFEFSMPNLRFGKINYKLSDNLKYPNWYLTNKQYSNILNTDDYHLKENIKSDSMWENLYRINKDETSFAIFENKANEKSNINEIELFLNNLNIPANAIIDKIYLDFYTDTREEIKISTAYQTNTNILNDNIDDVSSLFNISEYEIYIKNNLRYLYKQLAYYQERENDYQIEYYKKLIDEHNRQNTDINTNFNKENPINITNNFWNEVRFESTNGLHTSDVKTVYLILEGYNKSNDVEIESQLVFYDGIGSSTKTNLESGYFYKKIQIDYDSQYDIEELSLRFKFNNVQHIQLYNVKSEIHFAKKQDVIKEFIDGETITINGLDKYTCALCENIDGDNVRNGLTVRLNFTEVQNYLKIYSVVLNIVYHEKAFTNIIETSPDFNNVTSIDNQGLFRCNIFDEKISDMRQEKYTTIKPNGDYDAGFELDNRIYQAFIAEEDNLTSIELKPNGRVGSPDRYLKIAILDNYENLPNNVLKEVIVDASQNKVLDNEVYKYNICVNDLIPGNTYWFSIEPVDKTKQGAYRFFYNNYQINDFKLLKIQNGDVINQHASMYFRIYSKQNSYSFETLPYRFDITNNYTKDINLIFELQIYDGHIKNLQTSLFNTCICALNHALIQDNEGT